MGMETKAEMEMDMEMEVVHAMTCWRIFFHPAAPTPLAPRSACAPPALRTHTPHTLTPPQQNFVDYHKCINAKGEEFAPCQQFKRAYQSLCPSEYEGVRSTATVTAMWWLRWYGTGRRLRRAAVAAGADRSNAEWRNGHGRRSDAEYSAPCHR